MTQVDDSIAETTIVVKKPNKEPIYVHVKIGRPKLGRNDTGESVWLCHVQIDGLNNSLRPVQGISSFHALTQAVSLLYSLFCQEGLGAARFGEIGGSLGEEAWPDPGISMPQFFSFDVALDKDSK